MWTIDKHPPRGPRGLHGLHGLHSRSCRAPGAVTGQPVRRLAGRGRTLVLAAVAAAAFACLPTEPCACPPARTHAVVFGAVTEADGAPVAGAAIRVERLGSACGAGFTEADPDFNVTSAASGEYEGTFTSMFEAGEACLRVSAVRAGGGDAAAVNVNVLMRAERAAPARVRADIVFGGGEP